jgi:hypothetical protein
MTTEEASCSPSDSCQGLLFKRGYAGVVRSAESAIKDLICKFRERLELHGTSNLTLIGNRVVPQSMVQIHHRGTRSVRLGTVSFMVRFRVFQALTPESLLSHITPRSTSHLFTHLMWPRSLALPVSCMLPSRRPHSQPHSHLFSVDKRKVSKRCLGPVDS